MDKKLERQGLRREFSPLGWSLVLYYVILNITVLGVVLAELFAVHGELVLQFLYEAVSEDELLNRVSEIAAGNGWGYFLGALVGFFLLWMWKGKKFLFRDIWKGNRYMRFSDLISLICVFLSGQLLFQMVAVILETILNLFGFSAMVSLEAASVQVETVSMFLYLALLAPIGEEILFRGILLRSMLPYGKRFAILASAFLFGIFHGNLIQSPFAFAVGLVLGYTAVEYSIGWAMVLHMFNNLIIADSMTRITSGLPQMVADSISGSVILILSLIGVIFVIIRRRQLVAYFRENRMNRRCVGAFFSSPGVIVLILLMLVSMVMMIQPL